jgi:hypothetical protein
MGNRRSVNSPRLAPQSKLMPLILLSLGLTAFSGKPEKFPVGDVRSLLKVIVERRLGIDLHDGLLLK